MFYFSSLSCLGRLLPAKIWIILGNVVHVIQSLRNSLRSRPVLESLFKKIAGLRPATLLLRDSSTVVFLWILRNLQERLFYRTSSRNCLWSFQPFFVVFTFWTKFAASLKELNQLNAFASFHLLVIFCHKNFSELWVTIKSCT